MLQSVPVLNHRVVGFDRATEARASPFAVTSGSENFRGAAGKRGSWRVIR